ncbi:MAG TPA: hypothetical protein VFS91_00825, partial [Nitrobacter sp.]|nr:hypothetical protein [Nitrobacter sp.]
MLSPTARKRPARPDVLAFEGSRFRCHCRTDATTIPHDAADFLPTLPEDVAVQASVVPAGFERRALLA